MDYRRRPTDEKFVVDAAPHRRSWDTDLTCNRAVVQSGCDQPLSSVEFLC